VELFLAAALESLFAAESEDCEFILVNDGSSDGSSAICRRFAAGRANVLLLDQPNRGYGAACNAGLDCAAGEYAAFFEPDDMVAPDFYRKLCAAARQTQADMVRCNGMHTFSNTNFKRRYTLRGVRDGVVVGRDDVPDLWTSHPGVFNGVYRRECLNRGRVRFAEGPGASFQDAQFLVCLYYTVQTIVVIDYCGYHYRLHDGQSVKNADEKAGAVARNLQFQWEWMRNNCHADYTYFLFNTFAQFHTLYTVRMSRKDSRRELYAGIREIATAVGVSALTSPYASPLHRRLFSRLAFYPQAWAWERCKAFFLRFVSLQRICGKGTRPEPGAGALLSLSSLVVFFARSYVAFLATLPFIRRRFTGSWLFVDRDFKADDNAEHMYRWIMRNRPEHKILFALRRDSPDWTRLKQEGFRLIDLGSLWYAFAWLHCAWLISSNRSGYIIKPGWRRRYADIVRHRFCFLQHGITKDLQPGLNSAHADMLITAANAEYRAFVGDPRYVYTEREVRLTGFPRHDELLRKAEAVPEPRTVLVMPTWRENLVDTLIPRTGRYPYSRRFAQSEYIRNWQAVLRSPTLHDAAKRCGYTVRFFPHPYLRQQLRDFVLSGVDCPPDAGGSIQDILADTALLITDYSSVAMEIALLQRPILYFQFDRETFFTQDHSYTKGYFDYDRDGFGPVLTTIEALCARATSCMEEGCRMDAVYRERAEAFFAFRDQDNCRRVYEALCGYCQPTLPIDSPPNE
jgi:CDP-glycerol glycerophosphotransferase (TagB/SpsB family)